MAERISLLRDEPNEFFSGLIQFVRVVKVPRTVSQPLSGAVCGVVIWPIKALKLPSNSNSGNAICMSDNFGAVPTSA